MARVTSRLAIVLSLLGLVAFMAGCEKKEAAPQATPAAEPAGHTASPSDTGHTMAPAAASGPSAGGITQKKCPTCGGEGIDPTVFVEYKGRKVYFCCTHCLEPFQKNPEKYAANLSQ